MQTWIGEEFQSLDIGDERLNRRCRKFVEQRVNHPHLSIPASMGASATATHRSEVEAVYRLLDNDKVDDQAILQPHYDCTRERISQETVAIIARDTTEIDLTRPIEAMAGIGRLGSHDDQRVGAFNHVLLAMTVAGVPLGLLPGKVWGRDPDDPRAQLTAAERARLRDTTPFGEKESARWVDGYRAACAMAIAAPKTQLICVSDSESDIFELLLETRRDGAGPRANWIVRACQNRALVVDKPKRESSDYLFEAAGKLHRYGDYQLDIRARQRQGGGNRKRNAARSKRIACCELRAGVISIQAPIAIGRKKPPVTINVVLLRESHPPAGEPPIEWLLLTDLPVEHSDDIEQVLNYYCLRWTIETYFKVLKSGCRVEASQLMTFERFRNFLAVTMVVAWRLHRLTMLGREQPDLPCTAVLDADEWQAAYAFVKRRSPPDKPPRLSEMIEIIGQLGGWLGRKNDGPPGPKSMWIGFQRLRDLAIGWQVYQQFANQRPPPKKRKKRYVE
jgi:hypothetical protein